MERTRKITAILILAMAFCFVLVSLAQAGGHKKDPIWTIFQDGTDKPVKWEKHKPNPRFAIYDPGTPENESDDLVLDKETGLIWTRDANLDGTKNWRGAIDYCANLSLGGRKGWRLPTREELASLLDMSQPGGNLPSGHPFNNVQSYFYWSSTEFEVANPDLAWALEMSDFTVYTDGKLSPDYVWPVRGGN